MHMHTNKNSQDLKSPLTSHHPKETSLTNNPLQALTTVQHRAQIPQTHNPAGRKPAAATCALLMMLTTLKPNLPRGASLISPSPFLKSSVTQSSVTQLTTISTQQYL